MAPKAQEDLRATWATWVTLVLKGPPVREDPKETLALVVTREPKAPKALKVTKGHSAHQGKGDLDLSTLATSAILGWARQLVALLEPFV